MPNAECLIAFALLIIRHWILFMYCFKKNYSTLCYLWPYRRLGNWEVIEWGDPTKLQLQETLNAACNWIYPQAENQCSHPETPQMWHLAFSALSSLIDVRGNKWEK